MMKAKLSFFIFMALVAILISLQASGVTLSKTQASVEITSTSTPEFDANLLPTFKQLITTDFPNCTMPCWWGLQPGKTTLDDIAKLLVNTGIERGRPYSINGGTPSPFTLKEYINLGEPFWLYFVPNPNNIHSFRILFNMEADLLRSIDMEFIAPNEWLEPELEQIALPSLLIHLSKDAEIFLATTNIRFPSDLDIIVIDKSLGLMATYSFPVDSFGALSLGICVSDYDTTGIKLWFNPPGNDYFLEQVTTIETGSFDTPESLWGVSTAEFIQQVKSDAFYSCFNAPYHTPTPSPKS